MSDQLIAPTPPRRGKGAIITGLVLLGVGLVLGIGGVVGFGASAASLLSGLGSPQPTPATFTKTLDAGTTYAVYEQVSSGSGTSADPYLGNVAPGDVTVTAVDGGGSVVVTDAPGFSQTFSDGKLTYMVVATFDPPASGQYVVKVATSGSIVMVAPSVTAVAKALPFLALIGLGALLGVIGLIVLIVGFVRRGSRPAPAVPVGYAPAGYSQPGYPPAGYAATSAPAPQPTPMPAPGWYPDPERPGGQRYWNGVAWTEHRA